MKRPIGLRSRPADHAFTTCAAKRRRISQPPRLRSIIISQPPRLKSIIISKPTMTIFNLDDLPDLVLVEILRRLPRESVFQCMCMSKRWFNLISHPYFIDRFLQFQSHNQKFISRTLIFTNPKHIRRFFSTSEEPLAPKTCKFSLSFLPCFQDRYCEPFVVGAYKDLILCCATLNHQRDYYICNPYTKQWSALPRPPQSHEKLVLGFTCEPYFKETSIENKNNVDPSSATTQFQLNDGYRYRVVRIIHPNPENKSLDFYINEFKAEIFASETGKWTETTVLSHRSFCFNELFLHAGVEYNGILYWRSTGPNSYIFGLDPNDPYSCRWIDKPVEDESIYLLDVSIDGCLRVCMSNRNHGVSVWKLKDGDDDEIAMNNPNNTNKKKCKWRLVADISKNRLFWKNPLFRKWTDELGRATIFVLGFDPNDDDILYAELSHHIGMWDIRKGTVTAVWTTRHVYAIKHCGRPVFSFVLPWWPTPITRHKFLGRL